MLNQILVFLAIIGYSITEDQFLQYEHTDTTTKTIMSVNVKVDDMKKLNKALNDENFKTITRNVFTAVQSIVPSDDKSEYVFTFRF